MLPLRLHLFTIQHAVNSSIQAARRNLAIPTYASPSSAQEDIIWKQVSHQFAGRGLKRKQAGRQQVSDDEDNDGEASDEEEEVLSTLRKPNTRSKRARTSTSNKKHISTMTKAEVITCSVPNLPYSTSILSLRRN